VNVADWKKALADAARAGVVPSQSRSHDLLNIQTSQTLVQALQHKQYGIPACLSVVFADAVAKKEMIPLREFMASDTSIYHTSWLPPLPSAWTILQWSLRQIGVLGQPGLGDKLKTENFVVVSNVEVGQDVV
jgi:charged multivesicular body protein 7